MPQPDVMSQRDSVGADDICLASPEGVAVISTVWASGFRAAARGTHSCPTASAQSQGSGGSGLNQPTTAVSRPASPAGARQPGMLRRADGELEAHIAGVMHSAAHASGA